MRVEQFGDGEPELAILGGVHGDEPCGEHAIEALLDADPPVNKPVKCIIANERALERNVRYTETDLNRGFPGNPDTEAYEPRLAHELLEELEGCITLSLHSTQSYDRPFALVEEADPFAEMICPYLSIDAIVEVGKDGVPGGLVSYVDVVEVECGTQGSTQAAENAVEIVDEFLAATGAIDNPIEPTGALPVYELGEPIPKAGGETYAVHVENFDRVEPGEIVATVDDREIVAEESFFPVLLSADGYNEQFGFAAERSNLLENE